MSMFDFRACTSLILISMSALALAQPASAPEGAAPPAIAPSTAPRPPQPSTTEVTSDSQGKVAYYGHKFDGRKTASGEHFNSHALTMAHKTLPFGTLVRVTNLQNHRSVVVRVNDRGPGAPDRIGDLTYAAASKLHMLHSGYSEAKLDVVGKSRVHMPSKHAMHLSKA